MMGRWQRLRVGLIGCLLGGIALLACAAVVFLIVVSVPDGRGLLLSVGAASIPALIYAGIVLRLDHYEIEPLRAVAACFAWGAVGAILLSVIGGLLFQGIVETHLGAEFAAIASIVVGAPIIEETFKGIAILGVLAVARDEFDTVLDGLVYGALVGVGFAMTENILYFGEAYLTGDLGNFGSLVLARAVLGGLGHPAYTAVTGAAVGWSRGRYGRGVGRIIVPFLGWCIAVGLHVAWNGGLVVTAALLGEDTGFVELVAIQALIVIVPAALVLYVIARISTRHELEILRQELGEEVRRGTLTPAEFAMITDNDQRRKALHAAAARGGRTLRNRQLAYFHTAADLAFRHHHRRQGETDSPDRSRRDERDRMRLLALRSELSAAGLAPSGG